MKIQLDSVDLGKRAESYITFANWCRNHKVSPWHTAECISLCLQANRPENYYEYNRMRNQVIARLVKAGATEIIFRDGWPEFVSAVGEKTKLPFQKFI